MMPAAFCTIFWFPCPIVGGEARAFVMFRPPGQERNFYLDYQLYFMVITAGECLDRTYFVDDARTMHGEK